MPPPRRKGGRRREDGLAPGSPEADAADRERDRLRKQAQRAVAEPPPLPSTLAPPGDQMPPSNGTQSPDAGTAPGPAPIPWDPADFREFVDEALAGAEQTRLSKREARAREAGFSEASVKRFVADAKYPGSSRRMISLSGSKGLARIFNKLSLSHSYGEGAMALGAVMMLFVHNKRSDAEFKRALAEFKKGRNPAPEKIIPLQKTPETKT